jgi:hypothetical protein
MLLYDYVCTFVESESMDSPIAWKMADQAMRQLVAAEHKETILWYVVFTDKPSLLIKQDVGGGQYSRPDNCWTQNLMRHGGQHHSGRARVTSL